MTALQNSHRTHIAFAFEGSTIGAVPADAAAWAALEGVTGFRMYVETCDPVFILGAAAVPNADMQTRVGEAQVPHKGLPTADGGSIVSRLWSTGETFATGVSLDDNALGQLLGHALGGRSLGSHATIATVTSQLILVLDDIGDLAVGQVIGIQDFTTPGVYASRVFPAVIIEIDGMEITLDRVMPFTIAVGDHVIGGDTAYYDQAALTNPEDGNSSTLAILVQKGTDCWVAGGAHLALDSIAMERGMQPKLNWSVLAAQGYPPGTTGAVSEPTWAGTIEGGSDVRAIGRDTHCRLATYGATTTSEIEIFSAALAVGCPVLAQDGVTELNPGAPGRIGYRTEPADTTVTIVVALASGEQTKWTAGTLLSLCYSQTAAVGFCWAVDIQKGFLMGPPKPMVADTNKYELVIKATDNIAGATELECSKIKIARF
jgi:hypothetical protein